MPGEVDIGGMALVKVIKIWFILFCRDCKEKGKFMMPFFKMMSHFNPKSLHKMSLLKELHGFTLEF